MMYTRQLKEFLNELRLAKGRNCLIFAIAANSEEFVEPVESYDLHVNEIQLNGNTNLLEVLSNWEETSEDMVYFVEGVRSQFPWILRYLNLHRDIFYEIKRPVIIFGSEHEITEITRYAPDLWRFRSRTYDFTEKGAAKRGFLPVSPELSSVAEEQIYYGLQIFGEESENEIKAQIKSDSQLLEIMNEDYKRAEVYMSLAIAYLKLQDVGKGERYFKKVLEVKRRLNDYVGISRDYKRFGDFSVFKGEYNKAIKHYREAIRMDPDLAEAHTNLGVVFQTTDRPENAKKEFVTAKELFKSQGRDADVKKVEELLANS